MLKRRVVRNLGSLTLGLILSLAAAGVHAQESPASNQNVSPLPSPTGPVNDYAGVIDDATKAALNKRLIDFQRSTGVELAVAVVRTTGERSIFDYSLAVYRGWGIGSKGADNPGALLFIAVDDRKYFTQVSADLEDELPDGLVGSLQRQYLVPEFRQGNFAKGITDTIEAYIRTIEERSSGSAASPTPVPGRGTSGSQTPLSGLCCIVVIAIVLLIILANRGGRSGPGGKGWGGGGGFGGGGSALPWIIGSVISNAASSSSSSDWGSGSSSGWGGSGDWGGGGSDWGGFGGGGDASGGGAGGGW